MFDEPGVYAIFNRVSEKMYIGSSINMAKRWTKHRHELRKGTHHCQPLLRAIAKYGLNAFSFDVIEHVSNPDKLIEREQQWINLFNPEYNTCKIAGSVRGIKRSVETKRKLSIALMGNSNATGKVVLNETRQKLSDAAKKRTYSAETRAKMAAAKLGKKQSPELIAKRMIAIAESRKVWL
jgi:group I intron endonuclease